MVKDSFFIITLAKGKKKTPLTYLDSSNHENKRKKNSWKFETLRNNNDDNTLCPKLFALNGIENTFQ